MSVSDSIYNRVEKSHVDKLGQDGYSMVNKKRISFRGKVYDAAKFEAHNDSTVGKVPQVMAYGLAGVIGSIITGGFLNLSKDFRKATWGNAKEALESDEPLIGERAARVAGGVIGTISTAGLINAVPSFREKTWEAGIKGKVEKTLYFETDEEEDISHLTHTTVNGNEFSYAPTDASTIAAYVKGLIQENSPDVHRMDDGSLVVLENRRPGKSAFLVIPKGNFNEAKSIKYFDHTTGKAITDTGAQWRAINTYLAARTEIEEALDKKADKAAQSRAKELNITSDTDIEALRKATRKKYASKAISISAKNHVWRLASDDPNDSSKYSSIQGSFSKGVNKQIDVIHNKNMMEHKGKLSGEQPYTKRPKPISNDVEVPGQN